MMRWVLPEASAEALLDSENRSVAVASDTPASLATSWMVDFPTVRPPCDVATAFMDAATFTIRGVPRRFGMPYAAFARRIRHAGVRGARGAAKASPGRESADQRPQQQREHEAVLVQTVLPLQLRAAAVRADAALTVVDAHHGRTGR